MGVNGELVREAEAEEDGRLGGGELLPVFRCIEWRPLGRIPNPVRNHLSVTQLSVLAGIQCRSPQCTSPALPGAA